MHVVIGLITAVAALLFAFAALERAGVRLSSLNPFAWRRRAQWRKQWGAGPLANLTQPRDVASVLLVGMAKCEGEMTASQKKKITDILRDEFELTENEAVDQLVAATFMTKNDVYILDKVETILVHIKHRITAHQRDLLLTLMRQVGEVDGALNAEQARLLEKTTTLIDG